ncbi:MAG: ferritin-like domain-containing protein [Janthinobacterium lividum]
MNFLNILSDIEQVDPEVYDRLDSRRSVFKHLGGVGQKLTAAALPLFVGAVFNKAYGQTPAGVAVADVLNFALKLEYLESYFYQQRTTLVGMSSINLSALATIATDEANHVAFLRTTITGAGATPITDPTAAQFDYSGGRGTQNGPFADWRTNSATYLALAQAFEDTGVRAYKGAAPLMSVMANKTVLTAALNIHSVEARHASHIREMRRAGVGSSTPSQGAAASPYDAQPKSWISGTDNGGPAATYTAPVYGAGNATGLASGVSFPAEDNISQGGITLSSTTLPNTSGFPSSAYSEAFDEGLDVTTVSAIARGFTIATSTLF